MLTYQKTSAFMEEFRRRQGEIHCRALLGMDISTEEGWQQARETERFKTGLHAADRKRSEAPSRNDLKAEQFIQLCQNTLNRRQSWQNTMECEIIASSFYHFLGAQNYAKTNDPGGRQYRIR